MNKPHGSFKASFEANFDGQVPPHSSPPSWCRFPDLPKDRLATRLANRLLRWFERHRRDFPWRHTRDPYAIWVSEVMLQQTRANKLAPYFHRFLQAFPNLRSLAQASTDDVLRVWEGLGYYHRALALQQAAQILQRDYGGQFPRDPAAWQQLPGVGRYTANAVLSQAFDLALPIVEANSARVYSRLFACDQPLDRPIVQQWLWKVSERMLPASQPGDFNQAIMELGATICLPRRPRCEVCPVSNFCIAHRNGRTNELPIRPSRRLAINVREVCVITCKNQRLLILQRSAQAPRWPFLWEFPHAETLPNHSPDESAIHIARELTGLTIKPSTWISKVHFGVTRFRITMDACLAFWQSGRVSLTPLHVQARWLSLKQIQSLPVSTPQRRILSALANSQLIQ